MVILWEESISENGHPFLSILWLKDGNQSTVKGQNKQTQKQNNLTLATEYLQVHESAV